MKKFYYRGHDIEIITDGDAAQAFAGTAKYKARVDSGPETDEFSDPLSATGSDSKNCRRGNGETVEGNEQMKPTKKENEMRAALLQILKEETKILAKRTEGPHAGDAYCWQLQDRIDLIRRVTDAP